MEHDASKHLVYLSGEMLPPDQAKISVFDTAVTLGDTVTESTRTFGHRPFKLERHIERLYKSLKVSRINAGLSPDEMTAITLNLLEANLPHVPPHEDVWIVHNISRGMGAAAADPT
ncbi:MAG: branched-chain amino acid aminotransferase, partial [Caldilineaceae bacterium SB0665_bin_25]|nr:branched-chain amino acid aminotransferase [Caldilineaceae bacterium SB0665_bin_25]